MVFEYDYDEEAQRIRINCIGAISETSVEDYDLCMATTIEKLMEVKRVVRVVLAGSREYEYDFNEAKLLLEIGYAIERIIKERIISMRNVAAREDDMWIQQRYRFLQNFLNRLKYDPIEAYKSLLREIRHSKIKKEKEPDYASKISYQHYINNSLEPIRQILEECELIQIAKPQLTENKNRSLYRKIFHPTIRPNFIYTRYISLPPPDAELLERYRMGDTDVEIYKIKGKLRNLYHVIPPEFRLDENEYTLLDTARRYLGRHEPVEGELSKPENVRENLYRIGLDMIRDIANNNNMQLSEKKLGNLAKILTRYTAGLGILDLILQDDKIQDIAVNSPVGTSPVYIYHADYHECETNIVPSQEDAESWATRFRLSSGRPFDEANPVLDTELEVPGGRARVAAITRTLSPDGLGFSFRRHRDKPWTFPLFIKNRMIDSFSAGLLWFLIDGSRTMLIAGTRSSGKTSFLSSCIVQIMPKIRIVSLEDSVTGDCQIIYERDGKMEKGTVGKLIDDVIKKYGCECDFGRDVLRTNPEKIRVFSMRKDGKFGLSEVSAFIRHMSTKDIFEVTTRMGKKIKVTGDHSLFTLGKNGEIMPVKAGELKIDDYLVTPRKLPFAGGKKEHIDIFDYLEKINNGYFTGRGVEKCLRDNWNEIKKNVARSKRLWWKRKNIITVNFAKNLIKNGYNFDNDIFYKSSSHAKPLPRIIPLTDEMMQFFGLWLADGCYDSHSVIISVVDEYSRACVKNIASQIGMNTKMHSDGISIMINSITLKNLMKIVGFEGDAYTKKVPSWIYHLEKGKKASLLRGLFSGDGYLGKYEASISLVSPELIKDIQTLLLSLGIMSRINKMNEKDKTYSCRIGTVHALKAFRDIGFLQNDRTKKLEEMCSKIPSHDNSDIIPFTAEYKRTIGKSCKNFNSWDYISRGNNIGRQKLLGMVSEIESQDISSRLLMLAESDIFWDQIREIKRLENQECYVYDFSVPECENFVCENILAHNTLEIPVPQLRELGYNIERLKSRSVITNVETELPAEEGLRTALRLGDSALIVGEVRSREAIALYEAMRIGALANLVAGTIHGESAYGVFDRVVNDLGVPPTSFKATDIVVVNNMIRSPDGLRSFRRTVELTEIRKHWSSDPVKEGGFVNLLEYSAKEDKLKPTKTLLTGESEIINDIMSRVREWRGNWDAVWENIIMRQKILQSLVNYSDAYRRPDIMEAQAVIESNSMFHIASADVKEETGSMDNRLIYERWHNWLGKKVKQ